MMNLREFIEKIDSQGKLIRVKEPVSIKYEIASIMKKMDPKPILFENVKESDMPVAANIYSSKDLIAEGLDCAKEDLIFKVADATNNPKKVETSSIEYEEMDVDLSKIPILIHYDKDGGPYMSSTVVVAKDKELGINASYHRMMIIDKNKVVARILQRHFNDFIERGTKEFAICVGNSPQIALASAISAELGKSELEIANALQKTDFVELDGHVVPDTEIVMIAQLTGEEHDEGPFVDLTETYDVIRKQRVIKIKKIYVKKNPIYHALLPGGLEHKMLMGMPKEPAIFNAVNEVCKCKNVSITPGGCSWLHAVVQIEKQNPDDGKKAIEAAFKGHKSLKRVIIVDDDINIYDINDVEWAVATRFQADQDMIVKEKQKGSSLDPSSNLETRETTKVGIDATIPAGKKKEEFQKHKVPGEDGIDLKKYGE